MMRVSSLDQQSLINQYETLRNEALQTNIFGRRGHGLALFLSRGMMAWLAAISELIPPPLLPASLTIPIENFSPAIRSDVATVLVDMVLACSEESR